MKMLRHRSARLALLIVLVIAATPGAQTGPPDPAPDTGAEPNIFYGAVNPLTSRKPAVLVFVHGLRGTASDWWLLGDMYKMAYAAGFRTAFISLSADNSRNDAGIEANATVLRAALPRIAQRFGVSKMYLIGHSKGGIDIQAAMLDPAIAALAKAVFTISAPNRGTPLADWAFDHPVIAEGLGLLTVGVASLRTDSMGAFRALADPTLQRTGVPFYTMTGNNFLDSPGTVVTGAILRSLTPNQTNDDFNDGFVPVSFSRLPPTYANDLGTLPTNHFRTNGGNVSFHKIAAVIQGLELTYDEFSRIAADGFSEFGGDSHNTWAWSMKWFKGKLYVGTARENLCTTLLTSDVRTGTNVYPFSILSTQCPAYETLLNELGAEIWELTPSTGAWRRVFKSPNVIPIGFDGNGNPLGLTARDIGFRGMEVHVEPDGTEALYVGSVTSGSMLERMPFQPHGFPPPRILRTIDGRSWAPLPQAPGTFLGEVGNTLVNPTTKYRSFRSLVSFQGKLFATIADFVGVGVAIVSADPAAGNDAWSYAGPSNRADFPVWNLKEFNGFLYATTGLTRDQDPNAPGYGVYKTAASGSPPYTWTPLIVNGGYQSNPVFRAPNGLSMAVFKNQLYIGTNRPTELIRINPNDTWELVVGEPRMTPHGYKTPISGLGNGFGSWFNGHFWRMAVFGDNLYVTTWDWSVGLQAFSIVSTLDKLWAANYGFDIYRSTDGVHWTAITKSGLGDPNNSGGRSIEATPIGLFVGSARQRGGIQIFHSNGPAPDPDHLPPPKNLRSRSEFTVGRVVSLSWDPSPGAVRYQVYRALAKPLSELLGSGPLELTTPDGSPISVTFEELQSGKFDSLCHGNVGDTTLCAAVEQLKAVTTTELEAAAVNPAAFPLPYLVISRPFGTTFTETAPTILQSIYFIRAEDADGNLSAPSNLVGGPSKAADADSPPIARCRDVTVPCSGAGCTAEASINAGSFDPNALAVGTVQTPPGPYRLGATRVTLIVGNGFRTDTCVGTVTVVDQVAPTIEPLPDISMSTDPGVCTALVTLATPVATDNCTVASITSNASEDRLFPVGATVVTWTAADDSANSATADQRVTVEDGEAPTLSRPPDIIRANDPGVCGATIQLALPQAEDNCGIASLTNDAPPDGFFARGRRVVTWTATDAGGQSANTRQRVRVKDTEPPTIRNLRVERKDWWPMRRGLLPLVVRYDIGDNCAPRSDLKVSVRVRSLDPKKRHWDEVRSEDWWVLDGSFVLVRTANRGFYGDLQYLVRVRVRDGFGNVAEERITVTIPAHGRPGHHHSDDCDRDDRKQARK